MIGILKYILVAALVFVSTISSFADLPEKYSTDRIRDGVSKQITNLNLGFSADFFDISGSGFDASIGYKYKVKPSYMDGLYSRFDKYPGEIKFYPMQWINDGSNLGIGVRASTEVQFIRQFKQQKKAWTAIPNSPLKAPINSKRALKNMAVGDYASLIYKLSAGVGVGESWQDWSNVSVSAGYSFSAQYGVQVFRLRENHIRLRMYAERSHGPGFGVAAEFDKDDFDFFGTDYIDDAFRSLVKRDIYKAHVSSSERELYLADYVINLNNSKARKAYDKILKKTVNLGKRKLVLLNPLSNEDDIIDYLLEFTDDLDKMHQEDVSKKVSSRRVSRVFLGKDIVPESTTNVFKIGNALISYKRGTQFLNHNLTYLSENNELKRHSLPDSTSYNRFRALFSMYNEEEIRSANALLKRDENDKIDSLIDIGFYVEFKDKQFYPSELKNMIETVCYILGEETCNEIDWSEYLGGKTKNFRLRAQYILSLKAYKELAKLSKKDYKDKLLKTLYKQPEHAFKNITASNFLDCVEENCDLYDLHSRSVDEMVEYIYTTFHHKDPKVAFGAFNDLRWNPIFSTLGGRILVDMLPPDKRALYSTTVIEATGSNKKAIRAVYGAGVNSDQETEGRNALYDYVKNIQVTIFNRDFDLRLQDVHGDLERLNP